MLDKLFKRIDRRTVTHVVTCSCTGALCGAAATCRVLSALALFLCFRSPLSRHTLASPHVARRCSAPGLQDLIALRYELSSACKRLGVNYMGCHGGVKSLQVARALAQERAGNRVLVVCVELASLHALPPDLSQSIERVKMDIISNLLFADGCSAIVVDHRGVVDAPAQPVGAAQSVERRAALEIVETWALALSDSAAAMTWEMGRNQFVMTIDKSVKQKIEVELVASLNRALVAANLPTYAASRYELVVHPGALRVPLHTFE